MKSFEVDAGCDPDGIKHDGIISKIDEHTVYVSIITQSACNACHAKGVCHVSEMNEEVVEVARNREISYSVGDRVQLVMKKSLGTQAVLLGYIYPFLVLIITLILALGLGLSEGMAGLLSLGVLVPYYLVLYGVKDRLKKTFTFNIG